ncbi:MAG: Eco57I restriction-modification methylase domain-containing protein [Candidatus Cloacimonas sp.]|nr:Eco57I restriction-modification methylase domain-containing protein [Candidatus Cloacimonas sp.]
MFHDGLNSPEREKLSAEFGKIPYLNGGIFSIHELEAKYEGKIEIEDEAFESLFKFFEEWDWHLDTNITATGRDINPDVIGYIFEKYINDRAQMGAYYTKEDITDYIGKNTILPYLFDEVQRKHPDAFKPEGEIWQKLKSSDDQYIYNAVKHGINPDDVWHDLPEDIRVGLDPEQDNLVELRRCWNRPAPSELALPTEIWREVIARRKRYCEVKQHITDGDITQINDFITYNLDIRQFAFDLINKTANPKLVFQFYNALKSITILDPTCGSGAFLFAAMNILEELYEACINRMRDFVAENPGHSTSHLKKELDVADSLSHPNLEYFIYKSIILNNLYGVDIMNEAVEIAKLRLFLKLVACVDPDSKHSNYGLEPLPDIDFNIRCGNTLVGYANWDEIDQGIKNSNVTAPENKKIIPPKLETVAMVFKRFKEIQLEGSQDYVSFVKAKSELSTALSELTSILDKMLYQPPQAIEYSKWKESHQPFHWFAEFYEIMKENSGFDVIIGNPPYVEMSRVNNYSISDYQTLKCGNLYAPVLEKCHSLLSHGKIGVIVPLASFSTPRMKALQDLFYEHPSNLWLSHFEATTNPTTIFVGVKIQLSIVIYSKTKTRANTYWTTCYYRAYSSERSTLFEKIKYAPQMRVRSMNPRISDSIELSIIGKLFSNPSSIMSNVSIYSDHILHYRNMGNFFFKLAFLEEPTYTKNGIRQQSSTVSSIGIDSALNLRACISTINSTMFYFYWVLLTDCYHLSKQDITNFPVDFNLVNSEIRTNLVDLCKNLLGSLEESAVWKTETLSNGDTKTYRRYFPQNCKSVIDEIDKNLGCCFGLSQNEIDYLINYDIKYRMGSSLNDCE